METNKIIEGECLEAMQNFPDDSIDLMVTDPPYGYSFMNKDWDKAVVGTDTWKECLRVLKPGSFAFIMSAPRQDVLSHMIVNLGDAGFKTGFTSIYWTYASGFPKASNISKMVDKRLGAEREVIGNGAAGLGKRNPAHEGGFKADYNLTLPATPQAKALDGSYSGFQPKPAVEVIIVAMKPLSEKTYVDQAMMNQKGITWLDDGRIPYESEDDKPEIDRNSFKLDENGNYKTNDYGKYKGGTKYEVNNYGRFPANLLVSNDILNDGTKRKAGGTVKGNEPSAVTQEIYGSFNDRVPFNSHNDSGSFSRYFSLDAWWDERIEHLPKEVQKTFPFLLVPKASKSEKNKGAGDVEGTVGFASTSESGQMMPSKSNGPHKVKGNYHPTVKPIQLMSYLIILGSRENDIILDPFFGSGTTGIASILNNRKFIGIELNPEYVELAKKRLKPYLNQRRLPI